MKRLHLCAGVSSAVLACGIAGSALAQSAPRPTATVEELIVTARKREERLQDVPASITAFTNETLARSATHTFYQVAEMTPQLMIGTATSPVGSQLNLRGIGASGISPSIDQAISINIDGVQASQAIFLDLGVYDLERLEILKGPQALFYGKNSPGGVISLVSANPGPEFEFKVRTGYEFLNKQKFVESVVSGPITKNLGARLDVYASDQSGWFRNILPVTSPRTFPNRSEYFLRGTIQYKTDSNKFDATLKFSTGKLDGDNNQSNAIQIYACGLPNGQVDCVLDRNYAQTNATPDILALDAR